MVRKPLKKGKIPPFIKKIVSFLENSKFRQVVCWLPGKNGFQILNVNRFSQQVLCQYFKHNNLSSFVRQLNMYGFSRPKDMSQYVYCHPRFQKGNRNSMRFIQRKTISNQKRAGQEQTSDCQEENFENKQISQIVVSLVQQNEQLKIKNKQLSEQIKKMIEEQRQLYVKNEFVQCYNNNFPLNPLPFFDDINFPQTKIEQQMDSKPQKQIVNAALFSYFQSLRTNLGIKGHQLQAGYKEI